MIPNLVEIAQLVTERIDGVPDVRAINLSIMGDMPTVTIAGSGAPDWLLGQPGATGATGIPCADVIGFDTYCAVIDGVRYLAFAYGAA